MNLFDLKNEIKKLNEEQLWNHRYILEDIETRPSSNNIGDNEVKWKRIEKLIFDNKLKIEKKNILDVGCSDGYFSNNFAELGASKVIGIDKNDLRIKKAEFVRKLKNYQNINFLNVGYEELEIKNLKFDLVIALGLLHRLPCIYTFLTKITKKCNEILLEFKSYDSNEEVCFFEGNFKKKENLYFVPSVSFIKKILLSLNFKDFFIEKDNISNLKFKRTIILAKK